MRERGGRGRVGQVVSGHVNGLHGRDGTGVGRGDAFLKRTKVRAKGGLIAHGRRHAAQKGGHFGTGLGKAEYVVDEEEHVLMFFIAEVFRAGKGREGHAGTGSRRLVHLAVDKGGAFQNARILEFVIEVVTFTGAFTHAREDRGAAVLLGDVVDHLHQNNGLAHAGAAEEAHLAALGEGHKQVHNLDAGFEQLDLGVLVGESRSRTVDGIVLFSVNGAQFIHGATDNVEDAAHGGLAHGHHDGLTGVNRFHAAHQTFGGVHGDGANNVVAQVLCNFTDQVGGVGVVRIFDLQGGEDIRQVAVGELNVHNSADNLDDFTDVFAH